MNFFSSNNLLKWNPSQVVVDEINDCFCYVELSKGIEMTEEESRKDANCKINHLKSIYRDNSIIVDENYLDDLFFEIYDLNIKGLVMTNKHFFKDLNDENILICYN